MTILCRVCEKPIPPGLNANAKTCSPECRKIARNSYLKEYLRNDRAAKPEIYRPRAREAVRRMKIDNPEKYAARTQKQAQRRAVDPSYPEKKSTAQRDRRRKDNIASLLSIGADLTRRKSEDE